MRPIVMRCTHIFVVNKLQLIRKKIAFKIRIILQVHHWHQDGRQWAFLVDFNPVFFSPRHEGTYLYPSFQGNMSDNDTARLGLDFQRMLRINHMVYIAARYVMSVQSHAHTAHNTTATYISKDSRCNIDWEFQTSRSVHSTAVSPDARSDKTHTLMIRVVWLSQSVSFRPGLQTDGCWLALWHLSHPFYFLCLSLHHSCSLALVVAVLCPFHFSSRCYWHRIVIYWKNWQKESRLLKYLMRILAFLSLSLSVSL